MIGPDEYHEPVDDNAFTNVMARWNLRRAARLDGVAPDERATWLRLADSLVDGYDPATGIYEQFAGFFDLEPLRIADLAPRRPISADLLLGPERVDGGAGREAGRRADAPPPRSGRGRDRLARRRTSSSTSRGPRTAARSRRRFTPRSSRARASCTEAVAALRLAARIDLEDLTGTTAGGLHLATMGGVWQALAFGFAGVRPRGDALEVDPRLPEEWRALELKLSFRGSPIRLRIEHDGVTADADPLVPIDIRGRRKGVPK